MKQPANCGMSDEVMVKGSPDSQDPPPGAGAGRGGSSSSDVLVDEPEIIPPTEVSEVASVDESVESHPHATENCRRVVDVCLPFAFVSPVVVAERRGTGGETEKRVDE